LGPGTGLKKRWKNEKTFLIKEGTKKGSRSALSLKISRFTARVEKRIISVLRSQPMISKKGKKGLVK